MSSQNLVPAVVSALSILELLAVDKFRSATNTEIAEELSLNKSTCLRILKTLEQKEYVTFDKSTKRYSLGFRLILLGEKAKETSSYIETAKSFLHELKQPDITFLIAKRTKDLRFMYVAKQDPTMPIRLAITNETFPIPYGAFGKCFYAFSSDNFRKTVEDHVLVDGHIPGVTRNTITSKEQFLKEIEQIKKQGYAESKGEFIEGIYAIGCPIFDSRGKIVLSIAAYMFSNFQTTISKEELINLLLKVSKKISKAISGLEIEDEF